jgi:diguanylate cyclase (GGDEF)-like protein/PAS domain S-box-containing protein
VLPGFFLLLRLAYTDVATTPGAEPLQALAVGVVVLTFLAFARQFTSTTDAARGLAETTARNNEARFQALVQHSSDVIMILDPDGTIRYASPSMTAVFGHDPARLVATPLDAMLHPDDAAAARQFLEDLARPSRVFPDAPASGAMKREWRLRHADGSWLTVDNVGTNLLHEPVIQGLVLNTRDVTEQSIIKQQYMHQAFHDPLTDLANRSLFLYQVGHALARAQRTAGTVTVLFLDLDNFKTVNDSLGHAAGDNLLVDAARRLAVCVRESDLIARLGGDEFAVLVEQTASVDEVLQIAGRIRTALSTPFKLGGKEVFVNASIGIARTSCGETTDELVRNADLAMYVAKNRGKGQHVLFEPTMHHAALERLVVEADLRQALEHEEFLIQYQPIVALDTGEIIGAEALVRWLCRERGRVAPGVFIPIAEETGLIVPIGRWVLRRACREAQRWTRERGLPVRITVNLSGRQLQEPGIVDDVREALVDSGLSPGQLVLEITESMLMHDTVLSMARLTALKALGVSLALDDFGTGYSSLSYLQRYPIDILKIDKAFVDDIDQGGEGPVLASAIIALGATLRMNTVAEGIETEPQRGQLLALGCQLGQGYLFSPPLDAEEFWHLLLARGARTPYTTLRRREMSAQAA